MLGDPQAEEQEEPLLSSGSREPIREDVAARGIPGMNLKRQIGIKKRRREGDCTMSE